jgi:uncharacterized membrane protein
MDAEHSAPGRHATTLRRIALGAYLLLIVVTLVWEAWLAPKASYGFWLAVKGVPLLVPLNGLLKGRLRSHIWASLLAMLYLTEGLVLIWTARGQSLALNQVFTWALAETLLSIVFIAGAAFWVRAQRRAGATL